METDWGVGRRGRRSSDPSQSQNQKRHRITVEDMEPEYPEYNDDPSGTEEEEEEEAEEEEEEAEAEEEEEEAEAEEEEEEEEEADEEEGKGGGGAIEHFEIEVEDYNVLGSEEHAAGAGAGDRDRSISVKLSDPDVLDCFVCFDPLSIPVFQCDNGHIACSTCCANLGKKCPMCMMPIGYNRCRAIEKVLESIKISCPNAKYGCKETLSYSEKNDHEKKCIYVPCFCPHSGCDFVAASKMLSLHFSLNHVGVKFTYDHSFSVFLKSDNEALILQEKTDGNLFILNKNVQPLGNIVNISCVGPNSSRPGYHYGIFARSQGCCLMLQSFTNNIRGRTGGTPSTGFLVIPFGYFGSTENLILEIRIRYKYNATHAADDVHIS